MYQDGVAMNRVAGNPFKINWKDKDAVISYARKLGTGQTIFKHPSRDNYNITHTERTDQYKPEWVVCQT